ncbi:MAG: heme oxygenase [Hyphomicrobiales bacterium]|nr:MAG: heme oxygenase [Hyphomicrobiales bacterium]
MSNAIGSAGPTEPLLLQALRDATHQSHERVDAAFSVIDLTDKAGYARFLAAHLVGIAPVYPTFKAFAEQELNVPSPDFPEMLRLDLEELDTDPSALPALDAPTDPAGAAICYVVAGSRLGVASIGTGAYWPKGSGTAARYMQDRDGLAIWRALIGWMRDRTTSLAQADRQCASAIAAFDLFRQALLVTASNRVPG